MATILFTDADGTWKLHNGKSWPASRFQNWHPDSLPFGDSAPRLSDGAITMFRLRDDFGVTFELPMIPSLRSSNLVLQSESFTTGPWTPTDSPTLVSAAHTATGITLDLIGDDSATAVAYYSQVVTFTVDGVQAMSIFVKAGTIQAAAGSLFHLVGSMAGDRLLATITFVAGVPSVATGGSGLYLGYRALSDGVYRLLFSTQTVTASDTNLITVRPAKTSAEQGNIYAGGVQAERGLTPTPYLHNTTATRIGVSMVEIADRLRYHLINGGTCTVYTNDVAGSSYATCGLKPGTVPQLALSDRRAMEFTLSLSLINLAAPPVRMLAHYNEQ